MRVCRALAGLLFFLLRSVSIFLRIAYSDGQPAGLKQKTRPCRRTSSLLDCFALLALRLDIPASLAAVLGADSNLGLGMAEGLSEKGFWPLVLGVPR